MSPKNKGKEIKGWLKEFGQFQRDNVFVLLPNLNMDMPVQNHRTPCHVLKPVEMIVCYWVKLRSLVSIPLQVCHLDQVPFHSLSSSYLCLLPPYSAALPDSVTVLHPSSSFSSTTVHYKPLPCLSLTILLPISLTVLLFFSNFFLWILSSTSSFHHRFSKSSFLCPDYTPNLRSFPHNCTFRVLWLLFPSTQSLSQLLPELCATFFKFHHLTLALHSLTSSPIVWCCLAAFSPITTLKASVF